MFEVFLLHSKELLRNRFFIISTILIPLILYPLTYLGVMQFFAIKTGLMEKENAEIKINIICDSFHDVQDSLKTIKNLTFVSKSDAGKTLNLDVSEKDGLPSFTIGLDSTNSAQTQFAGKIRSKLKIYFDKQLSLKIASSGKPKNYFQAFEIKEDNIADKNEIMTKMLSLLIPLLSIVLILSVALTVAVEVTAGEKESKAAETLFVTPLPRLKIILGKIMVITAFAFVGGLINFLALGIVFAQVMQFIFKMFKEAGKINLDVSTLLEPRILLLTVFSLLILSFLGAVLFAGMASFAKNRKEANVMLTPISTILMFSTYVIIIPGMEGNALFPFLPVINIAMSLKMAISGDFNTVYVMKAFISSMIYLAFCFRYILPVMAEEDVLFGSSETTLWKKLKANFKK